MERRRADRPDAAAPDPDRAADRRHEEGRPALPPRGDRARDPAVEPAPSGRDRRRRRMADRMFNVLFVCTGNSARSIMAECAMNRWGLGKFRGYSAGSSPKGQIHPMAIDLLRRLNYNTSHLRSKDWTEFAEGAGGPPLDFVFTLCDEAAGEVCPAWPGQPMTAHWGVEDPAAFVGPEDKQRRLFRAVYGMLENRIKIFASLPIRSLDRLSLQGRLEEIGRMREGAEVPEEA